MFEYIHTCGSPVVGRQRKILGPYVTNFLYSLINGFTRKNFGYDSVDRCAKTIKTFYNVIDNNVDKLYIDSGGYSIIVGDVNPKDIMIFIDAYTYFIEYNYHNLDYLFSLDIPVFLKYPNENKYNKILKYNSTSNEQTKTVLDEFPSMYDNFIFVWQFKLPKQFDIWNQVYDSIYRPDSKINHFALGGMVGLRGITNIKFSPFVVPIYKLLYLVKERAKSLTSILHMLGVYGRQDRFIMAFIDKLFNDYYLKNHPSSVNITYDTVNYTISGLYNIRKFPFLEIPAYDFDNDVFMENLTPTERIKNIVKDPGVQHYVFEEMNMVMNGKNVMNSSDFCSMNVVKNRIIDIGFEHFIRDNNILNMFLECKNFNKFRNVLLPLLSTAEIKFPASFKGAIPGIFENFQWIYTMHQQWEKGIDEKGIDKYIYRFIKSDNAFAINYPFDLND